MKGKNLAALLIASAVLASSCADTPPASKVIVTTGSTTAGSQSIEELLTQAEREKAVAMASGPDQHIAWFDRWIADDIVFTGADGKIGSGIKTTVRKNLESGAWKVVTVSIDSIKVRVFGESAVVTAIQTEKSQFQGKDSGGRFQYTHVWARRDGRWQVVAGHTSRLE